MKKDRIEHALNEMDNGYIDESAGNDTVQPAHRNRKTRWVLIAGYAAAAAVLVVGLIFFFGRNTGTERTLNEQGNTSAQKPDPSSEQKLTTVPTEEKTEKPTTEAMTEEPTEAETETQAPTEAPVVTPEPEPAKPERQQPAPTHPAKPAQPTQPETPTEEKPEPTTEEPRKSVYGEGITELSKNMSKLNANGKELSSSHSKALATSGLRLLQKTVELGKDGNKNYVISPISIQMALGMTATGADSGSETEKELLSVIMPGAKNTTSMNKEMASFAKRMKEAKGVAWNVANSIWVNNCGDVELRDTYVADAASYYGAELYAAPFNDDTVKEINSWVSKNTKNRIPSIIDELSDEARLVLVNAVSFDGKWQEEYGKSQIHKNRKFTNADGSKSKVTMLSSQEDRAIKLAGGLGFVRPYEGCQYSFVGLLPPEGMTTEEYLTKIVSSNKNFAEAFKNPLRGKVYAELPEFKTEYGTTLDPVLKGLGMSRAYDNGQFKKMVTEDSVPVTIGTAVHKAMINVNRKGTEAAAATAIVVELGSAFPKDEKEYHITLDRPFVYAIVDNSTGVPVFVGVQNTMSE